MPADKFIDLLLPEYSSLQHAANSTVSVEVYFPSQSICLRNLLSRPFMLARNVTEQLAARSGGTCKQENETGPDSIPTFDLISMGQE